MKKIIDSLSFRLLLITIFLLFSAFVFPQQSNTAEKMPSLLVVQMPVAHKPSAQMTSRLIDNCSIHLLSLAADNVSSKNLTPSFLSARDPSVSFDGKTIFFAGKKDSSSFWQIYTMNFDGGDITQLTADDADHCSPLEVGSLFYLDDSVPTPQIIYGRRTHSSPDIYAIFASNADGSETRQISHNIYSDIEPDVIKNGRLIFSSFSDKNDNGKPTAQLMALSIDGTDLMSVTGDQSSEKHQRMPRAGFDSRIYFIEADTVDELGGGTIASVSEFRSLHSYKAITAENTYIYPCPLPGGNLLASKRNSKGSYELVQLDAGRTGKTLFQKVGFHIIDAQVVQSRPTARGRSSVVGFRFKDSGVFFCMNIYESDRDELKKIAPGSITEVLITEGVVTDQNSTFPVVTHSPASVLNPFDVHYYHRIIGRATVEKDGSFQVRVPSETPLTFHLLDKDGNILASQKSWTWVMHGESRGCIGCHEDRELTPPNRFIDAVKRPPQEFLPAVESRQPFAIGGGS